MITKEMIEKFKKNMNADDVYTIPDSYSDSFPDIKMPAGLNYEEKRIWALKTFEYYSKMIDKKYERLSAS